MYLYINPYVKVVKGVKRTCLTNLHDGRIHFFSSSIIEFLKECNAKEIKTIKNENPLVRAVIDDYLSYLVDNNLATLSERQRFFNEICDYCEIKLQKSDLSADILYIEPKIFKKPVKNILHKIIRTQAVKTIVFVIDDDDDLVLAHENLEGFYGSVSLIGVMPIRSKASAQELEIYDYLLISSDCLYKNWYKEIAENSAINIFEKNEDKKIDSYDSLCSSYENFFRLTSKSYYSNQMYITADEKIAYNYLSLQHGLGVISLNSNENLISKFLEKSVEFGKMNCDKCSECELRFSCNHPIVIKGGKLEPLDCLYDCGSATFKVSEELTERYSVDNFSFASNVDVILDSIIDLYAFIKRIMALFNVDGEKIIIKYNLYLNPANEDRHSKLIGVKGGKVIVQIVTPKLFDSHEIIHSIFYLVNRRSKFIVSEAYATIFQNSCSNKISLYGQPRIPDNFNFNESMAYLEKKWDESGHSNIKMSNIKDLGVFLRFVLVESGPELLIEFYRSDQTFELFKNFFSPFLSRLFSIDGENNYE